MKTVLYYDYVRNRRNLFQNLWTWMVMLFIVFVVSFVIEKIWPDFNADYLKWPDMVKEFLGTGSWNRSIYINLWYIFAILFPIHVAYIVMSGLTASLIQEERLETIVFLQNLSINKGNLMRSKLLFWVGYACMMSMALLFENILFLLVLKHTHIIPIVAKYYGIVFLICCIYLSLTLFLASYSKDENICNGMISNLLTFSVILAKVGPFIHLLADLMVMRGQEGDIISKLHGIGDKLDVLMVLCPISWSWIGVSVPDLYLGCGVIVAAVMLGGAFWIYVNKGKR